METFSGTRVASGCIIAPEVAGMKEVVLRIPEEIEEAIGTAKDLSGELIKRVAAALYAERKISLGKAAELSGMPYADFLRLLAELEIDLDYGIEDFMEDMETLRGLEQGDRGK